MGFGRFRFWISGFRVLWFSASGFRIDGFRVRVRGLQFYSFTVLGFRVFVGFGFWGFGVPLGDREGNGGSRRSSGFRALGFCGLQGKEF